MNLEKISIMHFIQYERPRYSAIHMFFFMIIMRFLRDECYRVENQSHEQIFIHWFFWHLTNCSSLSTVENLSTCSDSGLK